MLPRSIMSASDAAAVLFKIGAKGLDEQERHEDEVLHAVAAIARSGAAGVRAVLDRLVSHSSGLNNDFVRHHAELALGLAGTQDPAALELLEQRVDADPGLVMNALTYVGERAVPVFVRLTNHHSSDVLFQLPYSLVHLGHAARPALPGLLRAYVRRPEVFLKDGCFMGECLRAVAGDDESVAIAFGDAAPVGIEQAGR